MGESKKEIDSQKCEKTSCQFKIAELPDAVSYTHLTLPTIA